MIYRYYLNCFIFFSYTSTALARILRIEWFCLLILTTYVQYLEKKSCANWENATKTRNVATGTNIPRGTLKSDEHSWDHHQHLQINSVQMCSASVPGFQFLLPVPPEASLYLLIIFICIISNFLTSCVNILWRQKVICEWPCFCFLKSHFTLKC